MIEASNLSNGTVAGSISELIGLHCVDHAESISLQALGLRAQNYAELAEHMEYVGRAIRSMGIQRFDRVAVVLPNGPEMAAAFLGVAAYAACAPLNPRFQDEEFEYYLKDLEAKAIVLPAAAETPARQVADRLGLTVLDLAASPDSLAGRFQLLNIAEPTSDAIPNAAEDVALFLHTSGTTSRPKMVPLSHQNLCSSAASIAHTLKLTRDDRCLNVMPLFHIHGLVGGLLSSMFAGGSVVCSPGYDQASFPNWMSEFQPTWYTAVPTIHQAVLAQARQDGPLAAHQLRFIRSSSSSLPPSVMQELEGTFGVPVIESYGMTEAAHQMASNPLPPGTRKPGSVGLPAGPEMAIMDDDGNLLGSGMIGEIVIRGPGVTRGYANNPEANNSAFIDGWFRTGDLGQIDEDGYFRITGRTKEMINRGGENISPREIDEVLLEHDAVAQAVAFGVPHERLGEDLVAAVVTRGDAPPTERQLREYAMSRLTDFKVPSQIVFVDTVPKGPTGKLQRIGLHEKLRDVLTTEYERPQTTTEERLADVWRTVVDCDRIGRSDNFFRLGGDSLMATQLMNGIQDVFGVALPVRCLFEAPSVAALSETIDQYDEGVDGADGSSLTLIQSGTDKRRPFFLVPGGGGGEDEFRIYAQLIHLLGPDQPVYGLYARGLDGREPPHTDVETMAADYLQEILAVQPDGPFLLGGECVGGTVALEMARQLARHGKPVAMVCLMNTELPNRLQRISSGLIRRATDVLQINRFKYHWAALRQRSFRQQLRYIRDNARHTTLNPLGASTQAQQGDRHIRYVRSCYQDTLRRHTPAFCEGSITLIFSNEDRSRLSSAWSEVAGSGLKARQVPGDRFSYLGKHVKTTAEQLRACLDEAHRMPEEAHR